MSVDPKEFQDAVLPRLCDAAFGKPDDGWMEYQWAQFFTAVGIGLSLAIFGGVLLLTPKAEGEAQVLTPISTGFIGTGVGMCGTACGLSGGGKKNAKKTAPGGK